MPRRATGTPAPRRCGAGHVVRARARPADRRERLHDAALVVGEHHRHERHVVVERIGERIEVDDARGVDRRPRGHPDARRDAARRGARSRCTRRCRAAAAPKTARLSASVPPPVKTTSPGCAPSAVGHRLAGVVEHPAAPGGRAGARPTGCRRSPSGPARAPRAPRDASASSPRDRGRPRDRGKPGRARTWAPG